MPTYALSPSAFLYHADCRETLPLLPADSIDSVVTDPPYHFASIIKRFGGATAVPAQYGTDGAFARASAKFMHLVWDGDDVSFRPETWAQVLRVVKPGGFIAAFGSTRGYHRMACAIENAGFEIRDSFAWIYGTGLPKRKDQLKPAFEPIVLARKPLSEKTVALNVFRWGTGRLNINACRIPGAKPATTRGAGGQHNTYVTPIPAQGRVEDDGRGRWPSNCLHDGSDEVVHAFPNNTVGFFYHAKANHTDRAGSKSPTVKPIKLMQWLARLITPPGGAVLDPFAGSGTTGAACALEGFNCVMVEREAEYVADIMRRYLG